MSLKKMLRPRKTSHMGDNPFDIEKVRKERKDIFQQDKEWNLMNMVM